MVALMAANLDPQKVVHLVDLKADLMVVHLAAWLVAYLVEYLADWKVGE